MLKQFWLSLLMLLSTTAAAETVRLPPAVLSGLNQAQAAMAEAQYDKAEQALSGLAKKELSPPAQAYLLQFRGNLALTRKQDKAALDYFGGAYELNALPAQSQRSLLHTLAQLQLSQEHWHAGVQSLSRWMQQVREKGQADETIRANDYLLLAQGYAQLEQWAQVVKPVATAIAMKGQAPEDWYRLQLAAHFQLKQWKGATAVLELLVSRYPQRERYWEQLASVYQIRDRHTDALATLRAAWAGGKFTRERQYVWLAQLLLQQGLPQRAAELLAEAMQTKQLTRTLKHERLLAQTQLQARLYEQGRATLARIAQRQPDFKTWRQIAYLDMRLQQWGAMKRSIDQAVSLKPDAAELYLLSGIADVKRADYPQARRSFKKASAFDDTRTQAESWLNYLNQVTGEVAEARHASVTENTRRS
ncbi:hypothetical protein H9C73_08365 [Marinobacterium sp. AK62]|uniref:Tetratricopeptide repeat protein n=1 Tax=Marinobacterium alkalitolerans TaxID=1542925 RepID=A0ABS3ZBQ1_9GAMM|nr:hypothetical protein [Marinobacterium alkalitolerans]MBP0048750.1 hypothetical protein [Marinobacterium alkalitolerans]